MKKINNLAQLKAEKRSLKVQQAQLEEIIRQDWFELKESVRPVNISKQVLSSIFTKNAAADRQSTLTYLAPLAIAGKLLGKLKNKVTGLFRPKANTPVLH